jgi:hypothetical protein
MTTKQEKTEPTKVKTQWKHTQNETSLTTVWTAQSHQLATARSCMYIWCNLCEQDPVKMHTSQAKKPTGATNPHLKSNMPYIASCHHGAPKNHSGEISQRTIQAKTSAKKTEKENRLNESPLHHRRWPSYRSGKYQRTKQKSNGFETAPCLFSYAVASIKHWNSTTKHSEIERRKMHRSKSNEAVPEPRRRRFQLTCLKTAATPKVKPRDKAHTTKRIRRPFFRNCFQKWLFHPLLFSEMSVPRN